MDRISNYGGTGSLLLALLLLTGGAALGCGQEKLDEVISLEVGRDTYRVEVARSPEERQEGLMHRESLGDYEGMLFVFERDQHLSFWMKDTRIPLSIAFISADGTIREIRTMEPLSERSVRSTRAVRYALELPRGAFERSGAEPGDTVGFPSGFDPSAER
jgi:hypothetical protein